MVQELPRDSTGQWAYEHEKEGDHTWSGTFNLTYRNSRGKAIRNNIFPEAKYAFMSSVIDEWASDAPLHDVVRGCPGTCNAVIRAPALAAESCDHRLHPVNYSTPTNRNETLNDAPPLYHDAWFNVPFLDVSGSHEIISKCSPCTLLVKATLPVTHFGPFADFVIYCNKILSLRTPQLPILRIALDI